MDIERTFIMLKPDCIRRGHMGEVISRIEKKGYRITDARMMQLDEAVLQEHYEHLTSKPFFPDIVAFMTSGPVLSIIVEGENAVAGMRSLIGATDFNDMAAGTIRGDFATSTRCNVIHGSDSRESANAEIKRFFG